MQKLTPYYQKNDYTPFMMAKWNNVYQSYQKNIAEQKLQVTFFIQKYFQSCFQKCNT